MSNKIIMFISKLLTFYFPKKYRKNYRERLYVDLKTPQYKLMPYRFISLGDHCLVRMLLTATRLKAQKKYGEKTCPFDLAVHKDINSIANCIKNDFKNFYDDIEYSYVDDYKKELWHNEKFKSYYGHEDGFTLEQFKKRYDERIKNFLDYLKERKKIYFVYSNYYLNEYAPKKESILNLYNVLKEKRGKKKFGLILLLSKKIEGIDVKNIYQISEPDSDTFNGEKGCGGLFQLLTIGGIENPHQESGYTDDALRYYNNVFREIKRIIKSR